MILSVQMYQQTDSDTENYCNVKHMMTLPIKTIMSVLNVSTNIISVSQLIPWDWFVYFRFMMFNATFNNISVISLRSVLSVEETRVPRENQQPVTIH